MQRSLVIFGSSRRKSTRVPSGVPPGGRRRSSHHFRLEVLRRKAGQHLLAPPALAPVSPLEKNGTLNAAAAWVPLCILY